MISASIASFCTKYQASLSSHIYVVPLQQVDCSTVLAIISWIVSWHKLSPYASIHCSSLSVTNTSPRSISLSNWKSAWRIIQAIKDPHASMTTALLRFHQHFEETVAPLSVYLRPLQFNKLAFVSHLKIAGTCMINSTELTHLPVLVKNLGVLEIIEPSDDSFPFPRLSDRLVKAWSLHDNPFPNLKVLRIHTNGSLTQECLQYVTKFPALAMFEILGTSMDNHTAERFAKEHGWIFARWTAAYSARVAVGNTYHPEGMSLHTYKSWLRLTEKVASKSVSTTYADAGVQGYETYTQLEQPVLTTLEGNFALDDTHPPCGPFVSLTLGRGKHVTGADPFAKTLFFWRYWEYSSPDGPESRFSPAENAIVRPTPRRTATKARPRGEEEEMGDNQRIGLRSGGLILQPRKKLRYGSVAEALSLLQGD